MFIAIMSVLLALAFAAQEGGTASPCWLLCSASLFSSPALSLASAL
jgi:hypothetical protein